MLTARNSEKMMDVFIKDGKLTQVRDGYGPGSAYLTILEDNWPLSVQVIVGATAKNACASYFDKETLAELIDILKEVYEAMED